MAALTKDFARDKQLGENEDYPLAASVRAFVGACIGENGAGYARPLNAADPFLGFCIDHVDNSNGSAGALNVRVLTRGRYRLPVAGATAVTANNRPAVYASSDNDFTLTATSNTQIGWVSRFISSGICIVEFDAMAVKAAAQ